ncbi:MAG: hypothetical protein K8F26_12120 [Thiobacillus sp.]|jgi:Kef-type K+ transport system membrane component KefB|nr:hypothetical protein [Thiobacillus sp.]
MDSIYQKFALLLAVSAFVGTLAVRLRQPLWVSYIIVGIVQDLAAVIAMMVMSGLGSMSDKGRRTRSHTGFSS